jgi:hypothetical protein
MPFGGMTYKRGLDKERLTSQLLQVYYVMSDETWWTIPAIQTSMKIAFDSLHSEAGISARIRDFRKDFGGSHHVDRRRIESSGMWEYRLELRHERLPNTEKPFALEFSD